MVDAIAKAAPLIWLCNNTRGSLLLVVMAHAAVNTTGVMLPTASTLCSANLSAFAITVVLDCVLAAVVVWYFGAATLSRLESKQVQPQI